MDAFELLADETRADIVRALATRQRDAPRDRALPFSELRERVGVRDSGNFNYHLGKLRDRFVEQTDAGYRLTPLGVRLAALVVSGFDSDGVGDPEPVGADCPVCGERLLLEYDAGMVSVACGNDHVFPRAFLRSAGADRDTDDLARVASLLARQTAERVMSGVCPVCDGRVNPGLRETGSDVMPFTYVATCRDCGTPFGVPPRFVAATLPAVVSFWHERGVNAAETPVWELPMWEDAAVTEAAGEGAVAVTLRLGGDELAVTLDEVANVTDTERQ